MALWDGISHLYTFWRKKDGYMKQEVVLKLFFHMDVLTGVEIKMAFLIQK